MNINKFISVLGHSPKKVYDSLDTYSDRQHKAWYNTVCSRCSEDLHEQGYELEDHHLSTKTQMTSSDTYHWYNEYEYCQDGCGYQKKIGEFNKQSHNFKNVNGKLTCSVCGYIQY